MNADYPNIFEIHFGGEHGAKHGASVIAAYPGSMMYTSHDSVLQVSLSKDPTKQQVSELADSLRELADALPEFIAEWKKMASKRHKTILDAADKVQSLLYTEVDQDDVPQVLKALASERPDTDCGIPF